MIQEPENLEKWVERLVGSWLVIRYRRYQTKDPAYADIFMKNEDLLDFARQVAKQTLKYCSEKKITYKPACEANVFYKMGWNACQDNINKNAKDWMGK